MLTLHYAPNTCALATHIALEQAGAAYALARVDFSRQEQRSEAFLRLNPNGRVPALVTPQGVLTETPALLLYVAQCYPAAGLAPLDDPFALARVQELNSYLCSTLHVAHAHRVRGARWSDDAAAQESMKRKVPQNMQAGCALIESRLLAGPWVLGERYSISDIYLFTVSEWLEADGVDIAAFPKLAALRQRMRDDPLVQRVKAAEA
ncbi:MAG: glutathione S-transferase family protein [Candidatus Dactylopiibacterium sp.]|nr:glutathione S-transferase family protein [Candidatus Dactylopiibacterium sp.]